MGTPHTPEIEIFNVALELGYLIQIHSVIYTEFPVKISARLTNFKGWFGLIWHLMHPSPTTLPEPALWATYVFLKEHTTKIHFRGDSCVNQYDFQP